MRTGVAGEASTAESVVTKPCCWQICHLEFACNVEHGIAVRMSAGRVKRCYLTLGYRLVTAVHALKNTTGPTGRKVLTDVCVSVCVVVRSQPFNSEKFACLSRIHGNPADVLW